MLEVVADLDVEVEGEARQPRHLLEQPGHTFSPGRRSGVRVHPGRRRYAIAKVALDAGYGALSTHSEHTVAVTADGARILTS